MEKIGSSGRTGKLRRWAALLLCLCLAVPAAGAEPQDGTDIGVAGTGTGGKYRIEERVIHTYMLTEDIEFDEHYWIINGEEGILWVDLDKWVSNIETLIGILPGDMDLKLTGKAEGDVYTLTRENGFTMVLDFAKNTIAFPDYNYFVKKSFAVSLVDVVSINAFDGEGRPFLFRRDPDRSYDRPGSAKIFELNSYNLRLIKQDGRFYIPLSTLMDLCVTYKTSGLVTAYNGQDVFFITTASLGTLDNPTELGKRYYSAPPRERTDDEIWFGYAELCLVLDHLYGLKETHKITCFDETFRNMGIESLLRSRDPHQADSALHTFISIYLDDLHSGYLMPSWMTGTQAQNYMVHPGRSEERMQDAQLTFYSARFRYYPDGVPGYEEVGNTAYITFDHFQTKIADGVDYYSLTDEELEKLAPEDNLSLIIYAHRRINRENSPIENVVIDLSNNAGGTVDAAVFTIAWFLGEADIAFQDKCTGALSSVVYRADVNLDRVFDDRDVLKGKNLYCLMSPVSFSCGNLVPAAFQSSQKVTLIGRQSGGGSCIVQPMITTWGTLYQFSGSKCMSVIRNGSLYDIDQGIPPDYYISQISNFYDRQKLTEIINRMD